VIDTDLTINSVARHEAGHWLTWRAQGGVVEGIEICQPHFADPRGAAVLILDRTITDLDGVIAFTKARIITLWAGVYAQSFNGVDYDHQAIRYHFFKGGGRSDYVKAHEYLLFLKNCINGITLEGLHRELDQSAAKMVADNFGDILKIANFITDNVTETGKEYVFSSETLSAALTISGRI